MPLWFCETCGKYFIRSGFWRRYASHRSADWRGLCTGAALVGRGDPAVHAAYLLGGAAALEALGVRGAIMD